MQRVRRVVAEAGLGLVGDRYHAGTGAFSRWPGSHREVTFIGEGDLAEMARQTDVVLPPEASRRNLLVRGLAPATLVGRRFRVGDAVFEGLRPCQPCGYLERITGISGVREALRDQGGLRARILTSGTLSEGDPVVVLDAPAPAPNRLPP